MPKFTAAFTSLVPRLYMIADPYSCKVGVSPKSALTATLVVTLILDRSILLPGVAHSEMYKVHSAEELFSKRLANWKEKRKLKYMATFWQKKNLFFLRGKLILISFLVNLLHKNTYLATKYITLYASFFP